MIVFPENMGFDDIESTEEPYVTQGNKDTINTNSTTFIITQNFIQSNKISLYN